VSNRLAVPTLADWVAADSQIVELVSSAPHKFRTGQQPTFTGDFAWPYFAMADGSTAALTYLSTGVFVTGANTIVLILSGATR